MVVVAVAGGTGQLGRTLVEAILSTAKHEVFILSRKVGKAGGGDVDVSVYVADCLRCN